MTIKTAIIGLGIMGQRMAEHMARHPHFSVDTIWDPDAAACQTTQNLVPSATIAANAADAIAAADLVYLACPPAPRKAKRWSSSSLASRAALLWSETFLAH